MTDNLYWILDGKGNPVPTSRDKWLDWMREANTVGSRQIKTTDIGKYRIVTSFLGLESSQGREPWLFETLVMAENGTFISRSKNIEEAIRAHEMVNDFIIKSLNSPAGTDFNWDKLRREFNLRLD